MSNFFFQVASNRAKHMAVDETDQFHILLEQSNFEFCSVYSTRGQLHLSLRKFWVRFG